MSGTAASALTAGLEQLIEFVVRRVLELERADAPAGDEERSPWMAINKAAAYLDWPPQRLYKLTASSAIPHYKHEGRLLFHRTELDQWLHEFEEPARRLAFSAESSYRSSSP
jgi:excisionase family DNA binding protein